MSVYPKYNNITNQLLYAAWHSVYAQAVDDWWFSTLLTNEYEMLIHLIELEAFFICFLS